VHVFEHIHVICLNHHFLTFLFLKGWLYIVNDIMIFLFHNQKYFGMVHFDLFKAVLIELFFSCARCKVFGITGFLVHNSQKTRLSLLSVCLLSSVVQNGCGLCSVSFCYDAGKSEGSNELGHLYRDSVSGTTSVTTLLLGLSILSIGDTIC